jgi:hypothetical protein
MRRIMITKRWTSFGKYLYVLFWYTNWGKYSVPLENWQLHIEVGNQLKEDIDNKIEKI